MRDEKIQELELKSKSCDVIIKRKKYDTENQVIVADRNTVSDVRQQPTDLKQPQLPKNVTGEFIRSPITGFFYASPSSASHAFVKEGDIVDVGGTVCIIEAMKTMNEIKASFKSKIIKVLLNNGMAVNAGQDLFSVERV
jgi:acetyl-CoA carboxylase biotin carboxyl carrier protein